MMGEVPVCPYTRQIVCNVNQLGAHGLSTVQNPEESVCGEVWFTTSFVVNSIGAIASGRYREVVRWQEGPLWEVRLY